MAEPEAEPEPEAEAEAEAQAEAEAEAEAARVDVLRRRLYRSGASDDDLRRYTEAQGAPTVGAQQPAPAAAPERRARPVAVALAAIALVAVLAGTGAALTVRFDRSAETARQAAARASAARADGILTSIRTTALFEKHDSSAQQFTGRGSAIVPLSTSGASFRGGRAVLALSSPTAAELGWRATRPSARQDSTFGDQILAVSDARQRQGPSATEVAPYVDIPPSRIAVQAPSGVRWTLLVVFAGPSSGQQ